MDGNNEEGTAKLTRPNCRNRWMNTYKRCRFALDIISYAVWLCYRFNPGHPDIEDLLVERGITVNRELIRRDRRALHPGMGASRLQAQRREPPFREGASGWWNLEGQLQHHRRKSARDTLFTRPILQRKKFFAALVWHGVGIMTGGT